METKPQTNEEKYEPLLPIVKDFPPNFEIISLAMPKAGRDHTYSYGGKIYNPSGKELPVEIQYHELIHWEQQQEMGGSDAWWNEYCINPDFRLDQEMEAYCRQYRYMRERTEAPNSFWKWMRESMALALSGEEYGSLISYGAAEAAIKRYGKIT